MLEIVIWGGKSSGLWLQISFNGDATIKTTIYFPNDNFQYKYPHSNAHLQMIIFQIVLHRTQRKHVLQRVSFECDVVGKTRFQPMRNDVS